MGKRKTPNKIKEGHFSKKKHNKENQFSSKLMNCNKCKAKKKTTKSFVQCRDCNDKYCAKHHNFTGCDYCDATVCVHCINGCYNQECREHLDGESKKPTRVCDEHCFTCCNCWQTFCSKCEIDVKDLKEEQLRFGNKWCVCCVEDDAE